MPDGLLGVEAESATTTFINLARKDLYSVTYHHPFLSSTSPFHSLGRTLEECKMPRIAGLSY